MWEDLQRPRVRTDHSTPLDQQIVVVTLAIQSLEREIGERRDALSHLVALRWLARFRMAE